MVSIIIPTYNEASSILTLLDCLGHVRGEFEVLVSDGSSTDQTRELVHQAAAFYPRPLNLLENARNRAIQCNTAAGKASGDSFLFLHADILVPVETVEAIEDRLLDPSVIGGNFQIVFEGDTVVERFFTWCYKVRRPFGIYYGDSGMFVRRKVFERIGGFKPIPIMDDYEFVRRMERTGRTVCLNPPMLVSNRRWRVQGFLPTLFSWVWIQTLYSLGIPAEHLARWYSPVRNIKKPRQISGMLDSENNAAGVLDRTNYLK